MEWELYMEQGGNFKTNQCLGPRIYSEATFRWQKEPGYIRGSCPRNEGGWL